MATPPISHLDYEQVIPLVLDEANRALQVEDLSLLAAFDPVTGAIKVEGASGGLVTVPYDYVAITPVPSGNGATQPGTIVYKAGGSAGTVVSTVTLTYDANNNVSTITKTPTV